MTTTLIIARREFKSYFDSPIAYVVIGLSLVIVGWLAFKDYWTVNRPTMGPLFQWLPWLLMFPIVPSLTMRLFAEEKRTGTLEILITMPVRDIDVVLGKYLATIGLMLVLAILTLPYPLMIMRLGSLDWGPVGAAYLGFILDAAASLAIGAFFSSITENQIVALFCTTVVLFVLLVLDYLGSSTAGWLGDVCAFLSFQHRMQIFTRGLIDMRNVIFFISVATFFLMLTVRSLESRKWK